jgi:hypothetical protein
LPGHCESTDIASISKTVAQYGAWLDYDVIPVVGIADNVTDLAAGIAWAGSAGGIG